MTRKIKPLAILSLAVAPVVLISGSAFADVIFNPINGSQENGAAPVSSPARQAYWPGPTAVSNGGLPSIIGTDPVIQTDAPNDVPTTGTVIQLGGAAQAVAAETFTVTSTFTLGALAIEGNAGGAFTSGDFTLHLFELGPGTTATSGGYTPSTAVETTATNTTGDLLGVGSNGVGEGIPITVPAASSQELMELDFTNNAGNGGTNDQVTLTPGLYSFEFWEPNSSSNMFNFIRDGGAGSGPGTGDVYTGGQVYATNDNVNGPVELSTTSRNQVSGSARAMLMAIYAEPNIVTATWNVNTGGDWNVGSNWALGSSPNGPGAVANFTSAISANHTVFTDTAVTVGTINFNNTNKYVLSGAASLTMQVSSGSAQINVGTSGGSVQTQEINLPLTIASNTVFNVPTAGSELLIANPITVNSGISVTTTGSGSVVYQSLITLDSGASLAIPNSTFANTLTLTTGATATVTPHGSNPTSLLQLNNLSLGAGLINLSNNDMVVHSGGSSLATVTAAIAQGRNGGSSLWSGSAGGITSSNAAAKPSTMALGVEDNDNGSGSPLVTTFDGQPVADGDTLVKYTVVGDADLTGSVTAADYLQIDSAFNYNSNPANASHLMTGWHNGDFNYDGVINGDDYTLIDNAYNSQTAGTLSVSAGPAEQFGVPTESIATPAVPEPASLSLLGVGAAAMLSRRRRRM